MEKLSRRSALAALVLAPAPAAARNAGADAELIALGQEFDKAWAIEKPLYGDGYKTADGWESACGHTTDIVADIMRMPAFTMDGLRVKARAAQYIRKDYDPGTPGQFNEEDLLESILIDLLRVTPEAIS